MLVRLKQQILFEVGRLGGIDSDRDDPLLFHPRLRKGDAILLFSNLRAQYLKVAEIVQATDPEDLMSILGEIVAHDTFRFEGVALKFTPLVQGQLEEILIREYDVLTKH